VNNRISKRKFKNYKNSKVREFLRKTSGKIRVAGIAACFW
jgi:hypothetical protein